MVYVHITNGNDTFIMHAHTNIMYYVVTECQSDALTYACVSKVSRHAFAYVCMCIIEGTIQYL